MFKHIFSGLEARYGKELAAVRQQFHSEPCAITEEPCVIHWQDGLAMLREVGVEVGDFDDLSGAQELRLGELVKVCFRRAQAANLLRKPMLGWLALLAGLGGAGWAGPVRW